MASQESGFFESSYARTRSLIHTHSLRPRVLSRDPSLQLLSSQNEDPQLRPSRRASHSSRATVIMPHASSPTNTAKPPHKRGLSSYKIKTKKAATILRAVPSTTSSATTSLSTLERDMGILPNDEILSNIGRTSPESDRQSTRSYPPRTALSSIQAGTEMNFHSGSIAPSGTIGTYKHGRIEWQNTELRSTDSTRTRRPQIQVVIPSAQRNRPLPTSPFFNQNSSSSNHIRSASAELISSQSQDVSPPSGSKKISTRESMVSPLSSQQRQAPVHFHTSLNAQLSKSSPELGSSDDSHEDDASSIYSSRSSMTSAASAERGVPMAHTKPMNLHERSASTTFSIKSPVTMGIFTEEARANIKSENAGAETGPRQSSPRRYAPHPPIEDDREFRPTCCLPPARSPRSSPLRTPRLSPKSSPKPSPQPSIFRRSTIRKSSIRSNTSRRSLASTPEMGAIHQAIARSESKQFSPRFCSPTLSEAENELELHLTTFMEDSTTLSEAENDLEQHLTSFTDDNPFKWDDLLTEEDTSLYDPPSGPVHRKDSETINIPRSLPFKDIARQDSTTVGRYSPTPVIHRKDSVKVAGPPPTLPRKSSKRISQVIGDQFRISRVPGDHIVSQLKRNKSLNKGNGLSIRIPNPKRMTEDFFLSPLPIPAKALARSITPEIAENVILGILYNLESLDDLFTTAIVNRGFYRVFKRHELDLMTSTLRKMSPPAWEHREVCYPGHDRHDPEDLETARPRQDYTPTSYLQYYTRDMYIIAALKSLIKDKCESFVRPDMGLALASDEPADMSRVDDSLWRIWTFCKIFGCGKGREEDIVAQMDWLKGGVLVHQKVCTSGIFTTDSIDMNETLANAPECWALGNEGGLSAEQLFDMMELWNCLGVLLQPFEGRTIQAREYGIYENTDIRGGDIDGEEMMLDEWYYYLLTLGLSTVLDLAAPVRQSDPSAFILASQNGWIDWQPPVFGGTRRNFLKEAASRVYEDKIAATYAESSTKEVQRQLSKQRIQNHITELRRRKNSGERRPEVTMSQERPISEWEDVINNLNRTRPAPTSNLVSHIPSLRSAAPAGGSSLAQHMETVAESPVAPVAPVQERPASPPRRTVAMPLLPSPPPSTVPTDWDRRASVAPSLPSILEHPYFKARRESVPSVPSLESHPYFAHQHLPQHQESLNPNSQPGSARSAPQSASERSRSSLDGDQRPAFQQHPTQRIHDTDSAENTADKAIYRIVEMGFTPEQARQALRLTDQGDGLRVDRAVELLLRSM